MTIERALLAFLGSAAADEVLAPGDWASLNPQPIPPGRLGRLVGQEALRLAWLGERYDIGVKGIDVDDVAPDFPSAPTLPPWLPAGDGQVDPSPEWLAAYHVGLASTLAAAEQRLGGTQAGDHVTKMLEASLRVLGSALTGA